MLTEEITVPEKPTQNDFFKNMVLGHPAGLFVLFFTEMWERFSYYGMRALLVLFLTSSIADGGWAWNTADALSLYGTYTMGVYITPVLGGWIADRFLGYRWAVVFGALVMTMGHASMAMDTPTFLYIGISCLIIGNGLFKPNMTSIISNMYKKHQEKKDGAYSIFYMGVNAGAFLGIMLCGYIGEKVNWSWGFGLAGIFMFLGMLQFYFSQNIFGNLGLRPNKAREDTLKTEDDEDENIPRRIVIHRLIVVLIFSIFTVFFWAAFEQAGGSMTLFADRYTQRVLTGTAGLTFNIVDALLNIVPLAIITYVLFKLFSVTFKKYSLANTILGFSFTIIWGIVIWKIHREFSTSSTEVAATWFGILNSLFIICFAPAFSKWWESKYTIPASMKFGLGLILLGVGFGFLSYGSSFITGNAVKVSMAWLILAYLFHTLGELCLSPVGLSYVSKLVPAKWIGMMFGIYYLFIAAGNKLAGTMGGMIDKISAQYSLMTFFLIFTIIPIVLGLILFALHPVIKKLMHGVK